MEDLKRIKKEIKSKANSKKGALLARFFKTGPGQYGQGDLFLGLAVPQIREITKEFLLMELKDTVKLLHSKIHEERLAALFILVDKFKKGDDKQKKDIFNAYLQNTKYINNWDLVDLSAPKIVGQYLLERSRKILYKLAASNHLWEKRIAIMATFTFIRQDDFKEALKISKILLKDKHDLIHKAVGWMLREIGKRSMETEEKFLKHNYLTMPRTMLRYAIEKFPEAKRKRYLQGRI